MTMKTNLIILTSFLLGISFTSCDKNTSEKSNIQHLDTLTIDKSNNMKSYISIFEMDMPEMHMGIFPYEGQKVTGVIIKADGYKPSADGVTIYLNGGDNLQVILEKVEKNGGRILIPKTLHADESGYFATFIDSEGNKIGLHSPN